MGVLCDRERYFHGVKGCAEHQIAPGTGRVSTESAQTSVCATFLSALPNAPGEWIGSFSRAIETSVVAEGAPLYIAALHCG